MSPPNVWLTLDILAGRESQKNGTVSIIHNIETWLDKLRQSRADEIGCGSKTVSDEVSTVGLATDSLLTQATGQPESTPVNDGEEGSAQGKSKKSKKKQRKSTLTLPKIVKNGESSLNQELETEAVKPLIDCSFDLPKVSAQLERLMGTNIVRLTDKSYMQELRRRIKEDYNTVLQKRIEMRESKEVERERTLAISSRTGCLPTTLAGKPFSLAGKNKNSDLARRRAKLKTNRERNAERLIRQSIKWERERMINYETERQKMLELQLKREEELMVNRGKGHGKDVLVLRRHGTIQESENSTKTRVEDNLETDPRIRIELVKSEIETDEDESDSFDEEEDDGATLHPKEDHAKKVDKLDKAIKDLNLTDDEIINRLMETDNVEELYTLAEELIGATNYKKIKYLL